ncbi:hypothetical protein LCGC14_0728370 [marine sediment metagenome]|uniref:Uncharacterized protein n=1 Tax=marine sediment metagenome TaxID=412755 RepID=A0A0F9QVE4_9ZZZZ
MCERCDKMIAWLEEKKSKHEHDMEYFRSDLQIKDMETGAFLAHRSAIKEFHRLGAEKRTPSTRPDTAEKITGLRDALLGAHDVALRTHITVEDFLYIVRVQDSMLNILEGLHEDQVCADR